MQFKNKLLSGVIASAVILGAAGQANAVDVDVTISGEGRGDTTVANNVNPPLPFANEVADISDGSGSTSTNGLDDGVAVVGFDVSTGTFPSGNVIMQLQLNGGTFRGALNGGTAFDFVGCTAATDATANVSIGGANGGNTVTFLISDLNDCQDGANPTVTLPFDINNNSTDVSVVMTILTESGTVPVDNTNNRTIPLVTLVSAFTPDIDTTGYADVVADVEAVTGPYFEFVGADDIGDVEVAVRTNAGVDLADTGPVVFASTADIDDATVTVSGSMAAYGGAGDVSVGGVDATIVGSDASRAFGAGGGALASASAAGTLNTSDEIVQLDPIGTVAIPASEYDVSIDLDLGANFDDETLSEAVLPVIRNGTTAILPWTASNTQAAGTGSNNFVRVSNPTTAAFGPIFATVLAANAAGSATIGTTVTLAPSLAAGAEVVWSAGDLQTLLGNFGRADIEIAVEGNDAIIARLVQRTDGTYEINNR